MTAAWEMWDMGGWPSVFNVTVNVSSAATPGLSKLAATTLTRAASVATSLQKTAATTVARTVSATPTIQRTVAAVRSVATSAVPVLQRAAATTLSRTATGAPTITKAVAKTLSLQRLNDTFSRTVSNGFGTSDDGFAWTVLTGTAANYSADGTRGLWTIPDTILHVIGGPTTNQMGEGDYLARFKVSAITTGTNAANAGIRFRYDGNVNWYRMLVRFYPTGTGLWAILQKSTTGGGLVNLSNGGNGNIQVAASYSGDQYYWLRIRAIGSRLRARIWQDGTTEPITWLVDETDASLTTGRYALEGFHSAGVTNFPVLSVDDFSITPSGIANVDLNRATSKTISRSVSAALGLPKVVAHSLAASVTASPLLSAARNIPVTISTAVGSASTLSRQILATRAVSVAVAPLLQKIAAVTRDRTAIGTAASTKNVGKPTSVSVSATISRAAAMAYTVATSVSVLAALSKLMPRTFNVASTATPTFSAVRSYIVNITVGVVADVRRSVKVGAVRSVKSFVSARLGGVGAAVPTVGIALVRGSVRVITSLPLVAGRIRTRIGRNPDRYV